ADPVVLDSLGRFRLPNEHTDPRARPLAGDPDAALANTSRGALSAFLRLADRHQQILQLVIDRLCRQGQTQNGKEQTQANDKSHGGDRRFRSVAGSARWLGELRKPTGDTGSFHY
ncbi:MAG TPA: hypothetical protein VIS73_11675, partial [Rhodocyclaceae bacterium]